MNAVVERKQMDVAPVTQVNPLMMLDRALERGVDPDTLSKLMDLADRWQANQSRMAFTEAMSAFKASPPVIVKDKKVTYTTSKGATSYTHATLGNVCEQIVKGLGEHGLSHRWDVEQKEGKIRVSCVITHRAGHSETVSLFAGADDSGSKNSIQAIGSTITYLQRYSLLAATGLAADDQDDDGAKHGKEDLECIGPGQVADLTALMDEVKADKAKFLAYLKLDRLEDIKVDNYASVVKMVEAKRKQR